MIACRPETMSILPFALVCGCGGTSRNCTPAPATIRAGSFSRTGKPAAQKHEILIARDQWNLGSVWQGPRHLYRGGLTSACFPSVSALRREYGRGPFTQPSVGVILGGGFSSRSHCRPRCPKALNYCCNVTGHCATSKKTCRSCGVGGLCRRATQLI